MNARIEMSKRTTREDPPEIVDKKESLVTRPSLQLNLFNMNRLSDVS